MFKLSLIITKLFQVVAFERSVGSVNLGVNWIGYSKSAVGWLAIIILNIEKIESNVVNRGILKYQSQPISVKNVRLNFFGRAKTGGYQGSKLISCANAFT